MRPLPNDKMHGVIHTVQVKKEHIDQVAKDLNLPADAKKRLRDGDQIHIVREATEAELNRNKK